MLVVDASCVADVLMGRDGSESIRRRIAEDTELAAPHALDVEVLGVLRKEHLRGALDGTAATQAVAELATYPAERFGHQLLLERAWELRDTVRGWDAMYVALAEVLGAVLLTRDARLAHATGPICSIELVATR